MSFESLSFDFHRVIHIEIVLGIILHTYYLNNSVILMVYVFYKV